jgi:hypothetical protein
MPQKCLLFLVRPGLLQMLTNDSSYRHIGSARFLLEPGQQLLCETHLLFPVPSAGAVLSSSIHSPSSAILTLSATPEPNLYP